MASYRPYTEPRNRIRARLSNHEDIVVNNWASFSRSAKKDNPEREREATLSRDSTPSSVHRARLHTPHTYPRTKQTSHIQDLERLRHAILFDDETSGTENDDPLEIVSIHSDDNQSQDSGVQDATPDSNQIVGRLMQIRDYLKQASSIKESLEKDSPNSQEQFSRLNKLIYHLGEQEEGYLALLQKMLADRKSGDEILNSQEEFNNTRSLGMFNGGMFTNGEEVNDEAETGNDSEVSLDVDGGSEISECTTQSDKEAEVKALKKQRDLLKKMLDQQRMLKSLHERQADLLELQRKTDSEELNNQKFANISSVLANGVTGTSAMTNGMPGSSISASRSPRDYSTLNNASAIRTAGNAHRGDNHFSSSATRKRNNMPSDEDKDRDEKELQESDSSDSESDTIEDSAEGGYGDPPPTEEETEVPAELQALRQKLLHLKNVFDENLNQQNDDQQKLETLRRMQAAADSGEEMLDSTTEGATSEDTSSVLEDTQVDTSKPERRRLRKRLNQLQDKKQKMEHLLGELQTLRQYRKDNDAAEDTSASESTGNGVVIREQEELTHNAAVTAGQAETVLDVMEQENKLRKLEEVRGRLNQLRDLVQYYQAGNEFIQGDNEEVDDSEAENPTSNHNSEAGDGQDMSLMGNLMKRSAQTARRVAGAPSNSVDDSSDIDSNFSLGEFGDDPEIQEKVKKLQSARERLARLQSLVSMVQQWPESAEVLPEDLADLAATAMDDTTSEHSTVSVASTTSGAQSFSNLYDQSRHKPNTANPDWSAVSKPTNQRPSNTQMTNQKPANIQLTNQQLKADSVARENRMEMDDSSLPGSTIDSRAESEAFYLQRMEDQKQELQNLMQERNKLLTIQNELKSLHQQYTESGPQDLRQLLKGETAESTESEGQDMSVRVVKQSPRTASANGRPSSSRTAVTFSSKVVASGEPANELYSRMLEQKMKRQENRKPRGDEDQMTADVTTAATWGDSETSSSSSDESTDEDTPDDEAEIDEDDDGYPSDGIMQVEEEEEANRDSDRDTYTIENDYQLRQRYPVNLASSKPGRLRRPHTHKLREAGNPAAGDHWNPAVQKVGTASAMIPTNQERPAVPAHGSGTDMIAKMKDQLDATTEMCQHLLQEQRKQECQLKGDYSPAEPWLENRVIYSINQLFSQVTDMQAALQVTVDQVYTITQQLDDTGLESSASTIRPDLSSGLPAGLPSWARPSSAWAARPESRQGKRPAWSAGPSQRSRAAQTGNPFSGQTDQSQSEGGDRTPTQMFAPQNSGRSDASTKPDSQTESARQYFGDHSYSIPPLDLDKLIRRRQEQSRSLQSSGRTYPSPSLSAIAAGRVRVPLETMYKPGISSGICGTSYADNTSVSSAVSSVRGGNSSFRGADITPVATPTKPKAARTASSQSSASATPIRHRQESVASDYSLFEALRETIYSEVATLISQNENRPHFLIELFRELQMLSSDYLRQRGLYSIQELVTKFLTEDVASLQSKIDAETESDGDILAPQPAWMLYRTAGSEETPTESCVTTDDDEARQVLGIQHHVTPVPSSANLSKLQRAGSIKSDFADYIEQVETTSTHSTTQSQSGSAWDDPFNQDSLGDTVIHLEQMRRTHLNEASKSVLSGVNDSRNSLSPGVASYSCMSLASASIHWGTGSESSDISHDIPFACNSPLGDTAIDLQEAMQKVKDIDRRKEAKREARKENADRSFSTDSSSSAHDACSDNEDSTADIQMTTIDTQMLDRRIKMIMTDIIPLLREHMDNVCSSQLLEYLQQRVISLTVQAGEQSADQSGPDKSQEFAQFFQKQLFNILKDSLAKFEGRRMRDCGEEILVDISEILFNELAFFKLMQDLDDPEVKDRITLNKWRMTGQAKGDDAESDTAEEDNSTVDQTEDSEESREGEDVEEGEDEVEEKEEEDLGKDRDDAFADEVNTAGDQTMNSAFKDIQFELAPSETKPMTRIGSDEDGSDGDDDSSDMSTDDGDDTAISRQTAQDQQKSNSESENGDSPSEFTEQTEQTELMVSDLPVKLDVDLEAVAVNVSSEQVETTLSSAAADMLEVKDELAGSGTELRESPSTSATNSPAPASNTNNNAEDLVNGTSNASQEKTIPTNDTEV